MARRAREKRRAATRWVETFKGAVLASEYDARRGKSQAQPARPQAGRCGVRFRTLGWAKVIAYC
jgi:hypothetical protein